jgi:hypothetical protein
MLSNYDSVPVALKVMALDCASALTPAQQWSS